MNDKLKILVVGGGGREHAWSTSCKPAFVWIRLYCAPGNAGIGQLAECVDIAADDLNGLLAFAQAQDIDL